MNLSPHLVNPEFGSQLFQESLYLHYRQYLDSTPVFQTTEGIVYLTRYEDCVKLLSGEPFLRLTPSGSSSPFRQSTNEQSPIERMVADWMIFMDPPRHDVVRKAFSPPFLANAIKQLEPFIREQVTELVSRMPRNGEIEILELLAFPLPVIIIAEILGVPKADSEMFRLWSIELTKALDSGNELDMRNGAQTALQLKAYFSDLLSRRSLLPKHGLLDIVLNHEQAPLTVDELLYGCIFLLWAGHETTKNLIANGLDTLSRHPEIFKDLQDHPGLIEPTVEEMLRYETPVQKISRWTHADANFGNYVVPQGTLVTALLGAANRDKAVFADPDKFDIRRQKNRHIAFGTGIHHCLGALLA